MDTIKYIVILLCLFIFGCENPIDNPKTDKIADVPSVLQISIYQNYGKCDTSGCIGESSVLLVEQVSDGKGHPFEFTTGPDSVFNGSIWLQSQEIFMITQVTGRHIFLVEIGDYAYYLQGSQSNQLYLGNNTNYLILVQ